MKSRLVALILVGSLSTTAVAGPEIWAPSPLTIILQVGQWIWKEKEEVYHVKIRARGKDEQDARDQAFRLAVEQATGSLLLSHTTIKDGEVKKHEIINYSSGFVHDFKILDRQYQQDHVTIDLDVWVRKSSIADRLLNQSVGSHQLPGDKIVQSHSSLKHQREQGDRVLASVLEDFPKRAFDIVYDKINSSMTPDRRLLLQVDYTISWNRKYVQALADAMTQVSQQPDAGQWCFGAPYRCNIEHVAKVTILPEGNSFFRDIRYLGFTDQNKVNVMYQGTNSKNPVIQISLHDGVGNIGYKGCFTLNELSNTDFYPARSFVRVRDDRSIIDGVLSVSTRSEFTVDPVQVESTRKVDITVVSADRCRH